MDDSTNVGDGDGRPDAGEVIDFYPIVRNSWGKAKNIKLSIELGENEDPQIVEFIKKEADFGSELSAYGKGKSAEPLRIKINGKCADNPTYPPCHQGNVRRYGEGNNSRDYSHRGERRRNWWRYKGRYDALS